MRILDVQGSSFNDDYSDIEIHLQADEGHVHKLELSFGALDAVVFKLNQALNIARQEAQRKGDNRDILYAKVEDAKVQGFAGQGFVGLSMRTEDGLIHYFALPMALSA